MKALSIYISLFFFTLCLAAPTVVVLGKLKVKETKVVKLFDMEEEEEDRDTDKETEKESDSTEKFFKSFFVAAILNESFHITLNHYHFYQRFLSEPTREIITPPPRAV